MILTFTINGTNLNPKGNPLPKLKKTGGQSWTPEAQRYEGYKAYVSMLFQREVKAKYPDVILKDVNRLARLQIDSRYRKPIDLGGFRKMRMDIMIYFSSEARGDPENIFGAIADALFVNDKYLAGSFDFAEGIHEKGRVEVKITI